MSTPTAVGRELHIHFKDNGSVLCTLGDVCWVTLGHQLDVARGSESHLSHEIVRPETDDFRHVDRAVLLTVAVHDFDHLVGALLDNLN